MEGSDAALTEVERADALDAMSDWVAAHPLPNDPQWVSAAGELISPRRLVAGMRQEDEVGRFWYACLAFAKTGAAPVGFREILDAHRGQAAQWRADSGRHEGLG